MSKILDAAYSGNTSLVRKILQECKPKVPSPLDKGGIALHTVVSRGFLTATQTLIEAGVNINSEDHTNGQTALHCAAKNGLQEITSYLLSLSGIEVDAPDNKGDTPLILAAKLGSIPILDLLIQSHAKVNNRNKSLESALWIAARWGKTEAVAKLLGANALVDLEDDTDKSPLMVAATLGHLETVKKLKEANANVNKVSKPDGCTALLAATQTGQVSVIDFLLQSKADMEAIDLKTRKSALFLAVQFQRDEAVKLLLTANADITTRLPGGIGILSEAAHKGTLCSIKMLIDAKCDPNDACENGFTPLMFATLRDYSSTNPLADVLQVGQSMSPLDLFKTLQDKQNIEILQYLLDQKADLYKEVPTMTAQTSPLSAAIECGSEPAFQFLFNEIIKRASLTENAEAIAKVIITASYYTLKFIRPKMLKFILSNDAHAKIIRYSIDYDFGEMLKHNFVKGIEMLFEFKLVDPNACITKTIGVSFGKDSKEQDVSVIFPRSTPLIIAASQGYLETVKTLIEAGANPETAAISVVPSKHYDASIKNIDSISIDGQNNKRYFIITPITIAVLGNKINVASFILSKMVIVRLKDFMKNHFKDFSKLRENITKLKNLSDRTCDILLDLIPSIDFDHTLWIPCTAFSKHRFSSSFLNNIPSIGVGISESC